MILFLEIVVCVMLVGFGLTMLTRLFTGSAAVIDRAVARRRAGLAAVPQERLVGLFLAALVVLFFASWYWHF